MVNSYHILSDNFQGQRAYRLDLNHNHRPDADEPILVERDKDSWKPVTDLDGPVDRFKLEKNLGYWTDRQISHKEGIFFVKEVVDRPKDGKIQEDEVSTSGFRRLGNSGNFELGAEIVKTPDGALFLDEHSRSYGPYRIIGKGDIQDMENYRGNEANWLVAKQPPAPVLIGSAGPVVLGPNGATVDIPLHEPKPQPVLIGSAGPVVLGPNGATVEIPLHEPKPEPVLIGSAGPVVLTGSGTTVTIPLHQPKPQPVLIGSAGPVVLTGSGTTVTIPLHEPKPQPVLIGSAGPVVLSGNGVTVEIPLHEPESAPKK